MYHSEIDIVSDHFVTKIFILKLNNAAKAVHWTVLISQDSQLMTLMYCIFRKRKRRKFGNWLLRLTALIKSLKYIVRSCLHFLKTWRTRSWSSQLKFKMQSFPWKNRNDMIQQSHANHLGIQPLETEKREGTHYLEVLLLPSDTE